MARKYKICLIVLALIASANNIVDSSGEAAIMNDCEDLSYIIEGLTERSIDKINLPLSKRIEFARLSIYFAERAKCNDILVSTSLNYKNILASKGKTIQTIDALTDLYDKYFYELDDGLKIELLSAKGSVYFLSGYYYNSLDCLYRALNLANLSSLDRNKTIILNKLGKIYERLGETEKAWHYYILANNMAEQNGFDDQIIQSLINLGNVKNTEVSSDSAMILLKNAYLKSNEAACNDGLIFSSLALAKKYYTLNNYERANYYINNALEYCMLTMEPLSLAEVYFHKGEILAGMDDFENAYQYYIKAYEIGSETDMFELLGKSSKRIADIYLKENEYQNALQYMEKYAYYKAEIETIHQKDMLSLANSYLFSSLRYQVKESDKTLGLNVFMLSIMVIIAAFLFIFFLLINKIKSRRKHEYILQESLKEKENSNQALKFSESKYYSLIRTLNEGLVYLDSEDKILFVNDKACLIFGGIIDDLVNSSIYDFIEESTDVKMFMAKQGQRKMGVADSYELKMKKVHGEVIWVKLSLSALFDEDKKWIGSVGMISDITERKEYDNSMKELTTILNQKIKQLNCLYDISDITSIPGITFDEIFVKSLNIIPFGFKYSHDINVEIAFEDQKFYSDNFCGTEWSYMVPIKVQKKKLGHIRVCYVEEKPFINRDPFHFNEKILIKNIAEKLGQVIEVKNMGNQLESSKRKLELAQKIAKLGNMEWDVIKNRIIYSESFFNLLEIPVENRFFFEDEMFFKMIHVDDRKHIRKNFDKIINNDFKNISFKSRFVQFDGKIKTLSFKGDIIQADNDKPIKIIFTVQDITEQIKNVQVKNSIRGENE